MALALVATDFNPGRNAPIGRKGASLGYRGNTGQGPQLRQKGAEESCLLFRRCVVPIWQNNSETEHMVWIEPQVDMTECHKAANHQPRSKRENNRHPDLRNDKHALQLPSPQPAAERLCTDSERFIQVGLRRVQGGEKAKEN